MMRHLFRSRAALDELRANSVRRALRVAACIAACAALAACDEKLSSITGPTPNLEPTFSSINENILQATDSSGRSACVACHTDQGRTPSGGLNLSTSAAYNSLVGVSSRGKPGSILVVPGDPASSYLIAKLKGSAGIAGLRMPRTGPPYLTDGQIQVIERWIALGAKND
jgi:hypothetical protein